MLEGDEAAEGPAGREFVTLAAAARGQQAKLRDEKRREPEDEGGEVGRLQREVDQAEIEPGVTERAPGVTSALP
jgi:hypothetical protein